MCKFLLLIKYYEKNINICICINLYPLKHKNMHILNQFP